MPSRLSKFHFENCQFKSEEKLKLFCYHLDVMEKEFGIRVTRISMANNFVCPDIDLYKFANSSDPMEETIGKLLIEMDKIKWGKDSKYAKNGL